MALQEDNILAHMDEVAPGAIINQGVIKNPGPSVVDVWLGAGNELKKIRLQPGEGVDIGFSTSAAMDGHEPGCRCLCNTNMSNEHDETINLACCPDLDDPQGGESLGSALCDCTCYVGMKCWTTGDMIEGLTRDCEEGLSPKDD